MPKHRKHKSQHHNHRDEKDEQYKVVKKRRRRSSSSSSSEDGRSKKKSPQEDDEEETTNLVHFSFYEHKHDLNKVIVGFRSKDQIIDDPNDFWLFVKKYEQMLKKSGQCILSDPKTSPPSSSSSTAAALIPKPYDKVYNSSLNLAIPFQEFLGRLSSNDRSKITELKLRQFLQIVLHYLDFKQKEKFVKLKKLRKAQANLPVAKHKVEIIEAVKTSQVVLIAGDTGCGKSTQIPQYLYEAGYKSIACTQPRRIACISLSKRVSHEMLCEYLYTTVGYQIRFERSKTAKTKILFITEGLLLRQLSAESSLAQYDVLVLDEVHERHLHGDFLLGVAKCLLKVRPELKLVLMSATININLFAEYFAEENVKVIEVPGRLYPIKLHYMPQIQDNIINPHTKQSKAERLSPEPYIQIMQLIDNKYPSTYYYYESLVIRSSDK